MNLSVQLRTCSHVSVFTPGERREELDLKSGKWPGMRARVCTDYKGQEVCVCVSREEEPQVGWPMGGKNTQSGLEQESKRQ